jgi:23S rRNA (uridine2552-2'-O)-methyltransferase
MGGDFPVFRKEMQAAFDVVQVVRPEATRERSYEVYVVGKGFRGDVPR